MNCLKSKTNVSMKLMGTITTCLFIYPDDVFDTRNVRYINIYLIWHPDLDEHYITFTDTGFNKCLCELGTLDTPQHWNWSYLLAFCIHITSVSHMLNNSTILFSDCKELGFTRGIFFSSMSLQGKEMVTAGSCVVDHFRDSVLFSQWVCAALVLISILLDKSKCKVQK